MKKLLLLLLSLAIADPASSFARPDRKAKQGAKKTTTKPVEPKFTRTAPPGQDHVYIQEDWTWNDSTANWNWNGNRWHAAPKAGQKWTNGRWIKNTDDTWSWVEGYWR